MLRLFLVIIFLLIFFIVSIPLLVIEWLISLINPDFIKRKFVYAWVQTTFKIIYFIAGVKLKLINLDNIPRDEPVLFVGNHQSHFDTILTYANLPNLTGFVSKIEIKRVPLLSWFMIYMNCVFLDRNDIRQGIIAINKSIELIEKGISVFIYPEGTRNPNPDEFLEFAKGSFKIAQRTNCPIVPVACVGSRSIFEDQMPLLKKGDVSIEFGKPFRFSELDAGQKKTVNVYTADIIYKMYHNIKDSN